MGVGITMAEVKTIRNPLKEAQKVMFDMLVHIDQICKDNDITYWLSDGSLLGSIRHKGFIPWDDDMDIGMLRKDYNKFKRVIRNCLPDKYKVETYKLYITGKHNWMKIMFLDDFEWVGSDGRELKGISIDIFPFDYVKGHSCISKPGMFFHRIAKLLYPNQITSIKSAIAAIVNRIKWHNIYCTFNRETSTITYGIETPFYGYAYFDKKDIFPLKTGPFEGRQFPIPNNADRILKNVYGDYMKIPREADWQIHMENLQFSNQNNR